MVDSADLEKVDDAKDELHKLFAQQSHQGASLAGIPLLVLGNKNDLSECLSQEQLSQRLRFDFVVIRFFLIIFHHFSFSNRLS